MVQTIAAAAFPRRQEAHGGLRAGRASTMAPGSGIDNLQRTLQRLRQQMERLVPQS